MPARTGHQYSNGNYTGERPRQAAIEEPGEDFVFATHGRDVIAQRAQMRRSKRLSTEVAEKHGREGSRNEVGGTLQIGSSFSGDDRSHGLKRAPTHFPFRVFPRLPWTRILMSWVACAGRWTIKRQSKRLSTEVAEKHGTAGSGTEVGSILQFRSIFSSDDRSHGLMRDAAHLPFRVFPRLPWTKILISWVAGQAGLRPIGDRSNCPQKSRKNTERRV